MAYSPFVLSFLIHTAIGHHGRRFPPEFQFGAATSAYQIEGAWNVSDKSESIWDVFVHKYEDVIADHTSGDVACDSYHRWRDDVQLAHNLGLDFYRFSVSWSRLLPTGFSNVVSKSGSEYYSRLVDGLLARNIKPLITLYHWDLPQRLQDLGGWTNPLITDWFAEYADVVFRLYSGRVKVWVTINEPNLMCDFNYNTGVLAPRVKDPHTGTYLCNKHVLLAHAKAWRLYDSKYRNKSDGAGLISLAHHVVWFDALTPDDEDAAELARQHTIGRYTHAIHSKEGGWPPVVEKELEEYSKKMGYATSRLPPFTDEEKRLIRGTYDYVAVNYYTSRLARRSRPGDRPGVFFDTGAPELGLTFEKDPNWPSGGHDFVPSYPKGLRRSIAWMRQQYGDLSFLISEYGYATQQSDPSLNDVDRIEQYKLHLEQVLLSMHDDGANITGFTAWTLMDNFEWMAGYTLKFGLHHVDFNDPDRKRTPKASAHFYADLIKRRHLDLPTKNYLRHRSNLHHKDKIYAQNGVSMTAKSCYLLIVLAYLSAIFI